MNNQNKVFGFKTGKHLIDIKAESEQQALVIFAKKFFSFIDLESGISLLGERSVNPTKAA